MKRVIRILGGIVLLAAAAFFAIIVGWLIKLEVWPAIQQGSLNVESSTMILNILWVGNELYVLLAAYILLAAGLTYAAIRLRR